MSRSIRRRKDLGRYRKVYVRMWADDRFLALSSAPPNAQSLWLYLLTGPHLGPVPGLFCAGEAALAERLGWPLRAFRRCWAELENAGMAKADWRRQVVWLPRAVIYNSPESPNVVVSWRTALAEIPECALKDEAETELIGYLDSLPPAFAKAFREDSDTDHVLPSVKPSVKASVNASRKASVKAYANQEQEQEQEQDTHSQIPVDISTPAPEGPPDPVRARHPRDQLPEGLVDGRALRRHGTHAWCSWPRRDGMCVHATLHRELVGLLGSSDADAKLRAWYPAVVARYEGQAVSEDAFTFWRREFRAWQGPIRRHEPSPAPALRPAKDILAELGIPPAGGRT